MNAFERAQSNWDNALPPDDSFREAATERALEEMVAMPDCFDQWLSGHVCPLSVAALLSLILDRGMPRMNGSERDDELRDRLDSAMKSVHDDFMDWAEQPTRFKPSPVDVWMAEGGR